MIVVEQEEASQEEEEEEEEEEGRSKGKSSTLLETRRRRAREDVCKEEVCRKSCNIDDWVKHVSNSGEGGLLRTEARGEETTWFLARLWKMCSNHFMGYDSSARCGIRDKLAPTLPNIFAFRNFICFIFLTSCNFVSFFEFALYIKIARLIEFLKELVPR